VDPRQSDLAIGAIASGGYELVDEPTVARLGISPLQIAALADRETAEMRRREALYRAGRAPLEVDGREVYLVDDGLATGFTIRAALGALREYGAGRVILAVPVGAEATCDKIMNEVDDLICPIMPHPFHTVALWYKNFEPVSDREVRDCLAAAAVNYETAQAAHAGRY
jgi:predicted phosphoribosyltransferase